MGALSTGSPSRVLGRYELHGEIAAGGMATVHFGRLLGEAGFVRTVAIKRLHPQYAKDPEFVAMFVEEARLAARIRHPNVVPTLDVVSEDGEIFLVMEYVQGESLSRLIRALQTKKGHVPPHIATTVVGGMLHGLHAAHEAKSEKGVPLEMVHRDVSPQNVLVGVDGVVHVLDFGVAKAIGRAPTTRDGQLKGKLAYMAPEQLDGRPLTRQSDVYAAAVVLWETLTLKRLFEADNEGAVFMKVIEAKLIAPSELVPDLPKGIDEVVLRGLARDPADRWATAREFALALEKCARVAPASEIGDWVQGIAGEELARRANRVADIERGSVRVPAADESGPDAVAEATRDSSGVRIGEIAELPSQVSSISVSKSEKVAPPVVAPRANRTGFVVGAFAALLGALLFLVLTRGSKVTPPPAAASPPVSVSAPAAPPPDPAPSEAPSAALPALAVDAPLAADAAPPPPSPDDVRPTPAPSAQSAKPSLPRPARPRPDCDPPFTRDVQGHKHYKLQCL
jgi:serine/threonine-protein kinase